MWGICARVAAADQANAREKKPGKKGKKSGGGGDERERHTAAALCLSSLLAHAPLGSGKVRTNQPKPHEKQAKKQKQAKRPASEEDLGEAVAAPILLLLLLLALLPGLQLLGG